MADSTIVAAFVAALSLILLTCSVFFKEIAHPAPRMFGIITSFLFIGTEMLIVVISPGKPPNTLLVPAATAGIVFSVIACARCLGAFDRVRMRLDDY